MAADSWQQASGLINKNSLTADKRTIAAFAPGLGFFARGAQRMREIASLRENLASASACAALAELSGSFRAFQSASISRGSELARLTLG